MTLTLDQATALATARAAINTLAKAIKRHTRLQADDAKQALLGPAYNNYDSQFVSSKSPESLTRHAQSCINGIETWSAESANSSVATAARNEIDAALSAFDNFLVACGAAPASHADKLASLHYFNAVGPGLPLLRDARAGHIQPRPTYADFEDRSVPQSPTFTKIYDRFSGGKKLVHVRGVASSGKSIAVLVYAFHHIAKDEGANRAYYIDISDLPSDTDVRPELAALLRLGENLLIIIDNAHHDQRAVDALLARWKTATPAHQPRLLIVDTLLHLSPQHAVQPKQWVDPGDVIEVRANGELMKLVARFLVKKYRRRGIVVADDVAANWQNQFGAQMHAFSFAVLAALDDLVRGQRVLSRDRGVTWIKEHWLHRPDRLKLSDEEHADLNIISAFGDQNLEMTVPGSCLSPVSPLKHSLERGVAAHSSAKGRDRYMLMEHGWGELILEAGEFKPHEATALCIATAQKSSALAQALIARWKGQHNVRYQSLLKAMAEPASISVLANERPSTVAQLCSMFRNSNSGSKSACQLCKAATRNATFMANMLAELATPISMFLGEATASDRLQSWGWNQDAFLNSLPWEGSLAFESVLNGPANNLLELAKFVPGEGAMRDALTAHLNDKISADIDATVAYALALPFDVMGTWLEKLFNLAPDQRAPILDALGQHVEDIQAQYANYQFGQVTPQFKLCSVAGVVDPIAAEIFLGCFTPDYFGTLADDDKRWPGAAWLVRALLHHGRTDAVHALADRLAERASKDDLKPEGSRNKNMTEMIGFTARGCSTPEIAQRYFEAMLPVISGDMNNNGEFQGSIYDGVIADGLMVIGLIDELSLTGLENQAVLGNRSTFGFNTNNDDRVDNYVRLIGAMSTVFPQDFFKNQLIDFLTQTTGDEIVSRPRINPNPLVDHIQGQGQLFWLGLREIARVKAQPLAIDAELLKTVAKKWQNTLGHNDGTRTTRHQSTLDGMATWLEACVAAGATLVAPTDTNCPLP